MKNEILVKSIFALLDSIENKTKIMAHHDSKINAQLELWQNGKLNSSYFKEFLNKYFDLINE